jgi:hypothetical protein
LYIFVQTAEERYQTAAGVEADLRRCLREWEARAGIAPFPLGAHDTSERLLIPEKLYGREAEIADLLAAQRNSCWCPAIRELASPRS